MIQGQKLKVFLTATFFVLVFTSYTFAQEYSNPYIQEETLPGAPGFSETGFEENIYLRNSVETKNAPSTQSKAAIANGARAGVYEGEILSCPYNFERDLSIGTKGEDVRLLQKLLNSFNGTTIATTGPGSIGKETTVFGQATKNAVKRFQETYIEYIGVANGRFGPRTRTVLNAICNSTLPGDKNANFDAVESVQKNATAPGETTVISNEKIPPRVGLASNANTVTAGNTFKVVVNFSEEIQAFTPEAVIVDGGTIQKISKLSKTSYSMIVVPNENAKVVMIQIEADKISDMAGNLNENASNEINVKVVAGGEAKKDENLDVDGLIKELEKDSGSTVAFDPINRCYQGTGALPAGVPESARCTNRPATFDSTKNCYSDVGQLPQGVAETARCNNPQNPNNPNNPNSACNPAFQQQFLAQQQARQQQAYAYGTFYQPQQNPCTNPTAVAQAQQGLQQAQQQQAQNNALGSILGNLLKGFGGLGSGSKDQTSRDQSGPGPGPGLQDTGPKDTKTSPAAKTELDKAEADAKAKCSGQGATGFTPDCQQAMTKLENMREEEKCKADPFATEKCLQKGFPTEEKNPKADGKNGKLIENISTRRSLQCRALADVARTKINEVTSSTDFEIIISKDTKNNFSSENATFILAVSREKNKGDKRPQEGECYISDKIKKLPNKAVYCCANSACTLPSQSNIDTTTEENAADTKGYDVFITTDTINFTKCENEKVRPVTSPIIKEINGF